MKVSTPAPPPAPDYASATRAGIDADISTLPLRNAINAASQLGTSYTDPNTGKSYDFTGLGQADINAADLQRQLQLAPETTQMLLDLQRQYGTQFADEARRQLEATDPTGFALREQFGKDLAGGNGALGGLYDGISAPEYETMQGNGPSLGRLGATPQFADVGAAKAGRADLERQVFDELSRAGGSGIDPMTRTLAEQSARARGASRGNILGDSAALDEALSVQLADQSRKDTVRNNALTLLGSGQTTSDKSNALGQQNFQNRVTGTGFDNDAATQEFNNAMAAIGQRNQANQNRFSGQMQLAGSRLGAKQQDLGNIQSFLGLQPVVSQGAQLSGLQNGAAPFMSGGGYGSTMTNNGAAAAGAGFAGNVFGTQAGIYGTQMSNSGSPLGSILGGLGGSFLGPLGTSAGSALGGKLFGK
jgi:hypothetical protein